MRTLSTLIFLASLLGASQADARLLEPKHDGFFLRFQAGPGYLNSSISDGTSLGGGGGTLGIAIGGTLANNLILYGELVSLAASEPVLDDGRDRIRGGRDTSLRLGGVGAGLAYYFMPVNLYVSGSLLLSQLQLETWAGRAETDLGIGGRFSVGKEWWVSSDWGLGIAVIGDIATIKDRAVDRGSSRETIQVQGLSLAFSATLN